MSTTPMGPMMAWAPDAEQVMGRARRENFPVAMRVIGRQERRHLLAVYGYARLADEIGDEIAGDRLAALDWLEHELMHAYEGCACHPLMQALQRTLQECRLSHDALECLIEANRLDQRVHVYESWEHLRSYCDLSANSVGVLVLNVFGLDTPERIRLSDQICTALQLIEHLQDVREDAQRGRVYIPADQLAVYGCTFEDVLATSGPEGQATRERLRERMRGIVARLSEQATALLDRGEPLVGTVKGRPRLAIAGFVAGARAAVQAIERADYDVLDGPPRASTPARARALTAVLARHRGSPA